MKRVIPYSELVPMIENHRRYLISSTEGEYLHFKDIQLENAVFNEVDFSSSVMINTVFKNCFFYKVDLLSSFISEVSFVSCVFRNTKIGGNEMYNHQFENCCFIEAELIKLDAKCFKDNIFTTCKFRHLWGNESSIITGNSFINTELDNLFYKNEQRQYNHFFELKKVE